MPKKIELLHDGQILTSRTCILEYMSSINSSISTGLLYCVATGKENKEYKIKLYGICLKLWFLSKMVYRSQKDITKLPFKIYKHILFDETIESVEEISDFLSYKKFDYSDSEYIYKCIQPIELLWCQMIGCRIEQVYISELAYAADYVISRKGEVDPPIFHKYSLFPQNYEDFHYQEGIAEYFNMIEY